MTPPPTISAIIPARNAAAFLREAIESVLAQALPVELIVVNDGSTDLTAAIARSYAPRVCLIDQPPLGLGAARNRGVRAATGEWIAFLDADDLWSHGKLAFQAATIAVAPEVDMVFGHGVEFCGADAAERLVARTGAVPAHSAGTMLARASLFRTVGGFSETGRMGEFIDWYSRARAAGAREIMLDEVLFRRRVHDANMTRTTTDRGQHYLDVVRAHLQRRRGHR